MHIGLEDLHATDLVPHFLLVHYPQSLLMHMPRLSIADR